MGAGRESHSFCVHEACSVCVLFMCLCCWVDKMSQRLKEGGGGVCVTVCVWGGGGHHLSPPLLTCEQRCCGVVNGKLNKLINNLATVSGGQGCL